MDCGLEILKFYFFVVIAYNFPKIHNPTWTKNESEVLVSWNAESNLFDANSLKVSEKWLVDFDFDSLKKVK